MIPLIMLLLCVFEGHALLVISSYLCQTTEIVELSKCQTHDRGATKKTHRLPPIQIQSSGTLSLSSRY